MATLVSLNPYVDIHGGARGPVNADTTPHLWPLIRLQQEGMVPPHPIVTVANINSSVLWRGSGPYN